MKNDDLGCATIVVGLPLVAATVLAEGFVLSKLWAWHAVPLGARALPWTAFAVFMVAWSVFRNRIKASPVDHDSQATQRAKVALFIVWPWLALAMGWWLR